MPVPIVGRGPWAGCGKLVLSVHSGDGPGRSSTCQALPLDTAVAVPREIACNVREKVMSKRYIFVALFGTIWSSVHLFCHTKNARKTPFGRC